MDNKGFLDKALSGGHQERFWKIRASRIAELNRQIIEFERKLRLCEERYGKN